jgi:hypothetical protein
VERLFAKITSEQSGRLDLLVNNAYAGVDMIFKNSGKKFYDCDPVETWDCINGVGLRGHYICTVLASRLMVPRRQGLIVNVSSMGGLRYLFNVAYGVGKAACDRMAADCAKELRESKVAMVSLWPGPVRYGQLGSTWCITTFCQSGFFCLKPISISRNKPILTPHIPLFPGFTILPLLHMNMNLKSSSIFWEYPRESLRKDGRVSLVFRTEYITEHILESAAGNKGTCHKLLVTNFA